MPARRADSCEWVSRARRGSVGEKAPRSRRRRASGAGRPDIPRAFWVALSRLWPRWRSALVVVRPETVVRWHRQGFRRYWKSISKPGPGRPPISEETRHLIVRMATQNPWRARKIQAELLKLGIRVSLATVSRYLPNKSSDPNSQQRWRTFLRNHKDVVAGMDFFVVPTARFRLLYVWFAIDHGRRRVLHFNLTEHPTARWVIQQLREALPGEPAHRFLIYTTTRSSHPQSLEQSRASGCFRNARPSEAHGRTEQPSDSSAASAASCSITWSS